MKSCTIIRYRSVLSGLALLAVASLATPYAPQARAADTPAASPSHQVVACYFHRTNRCPTCKKISAYIEESVQTGFDAQVKEGTVKMMMVDFQNAKNKKLTDAYKITGPTLVLLDIHDGKVKAWKAAPKVWSLVSKKSDFFEYVQQEVKRYLDAERTAAR